MFRNNNTTQFMSCPICGSQNNVACYSCWKCKNLLHQQYNFQPQPSSSSPGCITKFGIVFFIFVGILTVIALFKDDSPKEQESTEIATTITTTEHIQVEDTTSTREDNSMDSYELGTHYVIAKTEIENCLKNPKSADFPPKSEIYFQKDNNLIALKGYVYAENSFGATVKSDWVIQYYVHDLDMFNYTVTYIEIDGSSSGEWIDFE